MEDRPHHAARSPWSGWHGPLARRLLVAALAAPLALSVAACATNEETGPTERGAVVLASPSALADPPQERRIDVTVTSIEIENGEFDQNIYQVQAGAVSLMITATGGPYTFEIEGLVQPQEIAANAGTPVSFNSDQAGEFTMRLSGNGADDTAILTIRPIGGR